MEWLTQLFEQFGMWPVIAALAATLIVRNFPWLLDYLPAVKRASGPTDDREDVFAAAVTCYDHALGQECPRRRQQAVDGIEAFLESCLHCKAKLPDPPPETTK